MRLTAAAVAAAPGAPRRAGDDQAPGWLGGRLGGVVKTHLEGGGGAPVGLAGRTSLAWAARGTLGC